MTTCVSKLQLLLLHKLFVDFCLYIFSCYLQSVQFSRPEKLSFFILNINWKEVWRGTDLHDHHSNYSWYFSILVYSCISYSKFKTKIFFLLILFIYGCTVFLSAHRVSLVVMSGGTLHLGASLVAQMLESAYNVEDPSLIPRTGFSLWWLLLLELEGSRAWAYLLWGMWDLPVLGKELLCPALAGRFWATGSPEKSLKPKYI